MNRLQATLGKKPTTPAEKNRLAYHLKYAIGILQPVYMEWVLTELEASVVCGNVGDIEYFANIASSQAIHNGWSPSALYDMLRFFRDSKPFSEQWDNFKNELLSNSFYSHDVLINVPFAKLSGAEQAHAQQVLNQLGLKLKSLHNMKILTISVNLSRLKRNIYLKLLLTSQRGIWILLKKLFATYEITMMYS